MMTRISSRLVLLVNLALAYVLGVVTIIGFFSRGTFSDLVGLLAQWAAVIIAFALLIGLANLVRVHIVRVAQRSEGWLYSLLVIASTLGVLALGLISGGPGSDSVSWVFHWVYQPLGASIFSLLAFFLTTAFFRALRMRSAEAIVLLVVALIVVIGQAPFSTAPPLDIMKDITKWLSDYPVLAGARAIILGVAFGAIGISIRVLLGFDRPHME